MFSYLTFRMAVNRIHRRPWLRLVGFITQRLPSRSTIGRRASDAYANESGSPSKAPRQGMSHNTGSHHSKRSSAHERTTTRPRHATRIFAPRCVRARLVYDST